AFFVVFVVVAFVKREETLNVWEKLRQGNPAFIVLSVVVQVIYWTAFGAMYRTSYRVVGLQSRVRDLLPVWLASLFVNIAAPAAAPAVFLDEAARRGQSPAKAAAGLLVLRLTDFGSLCVFIACGIAAMATRLAVHPWQSPVLLGHCVALAILVGVTFAWSAPLFLARWKPAVLQSVLGTVRRVINSAFRLVRRPEPLGDTWAATQAGLFSHSADLALSKPVRLLAPLAVATVAHLLDWASIHLMLHAFGIDADPAVSLIAFSVCLLYWIVSPSPDGVGFVEVAVAATLVTIGAAQKSEAIAAALAFRGISLYLPVLIGGFCLPRLATPIKPKEQSMTEPLPHPHYTTQ
ncbi:MAG: flippase-like domain-containing protein, partial [Armatimonadetes bacterium]|nr:flippase-like domain-containing protein [Armatimonadota bacterium]